MRRNGVQGSAWCMLVIDSAGTVPLNTLYVLYADHAEFADGALRVLANSAYQPGFQAGRAVPVRAFQRITFVLNREE